MCACTRCKLIGCVIVIVESRDLGTRVSCKRCQIRLLRIRSGTLSRSDNFPITNFTYNFPVVLDKMQIYPTQNGAPETCMFQACFSTFHAATTSYFHA